MERALMIRPTVLLLDEWSVGLSAAYQEEVCERVGAASRVGVGTLRRSWWVGEC